MAFNGAGVFSRIYNFVTDKNNGVKIVAARMDAELDGMATGLSNCIARDGQSTVSQDIPFNSKKITALGNATADADALNRVTADARFVRNPTDLSAETAVVDDDLMSFWDTSATANKKITYANFKTDLVTDGVAGVASFKGRQGAVVAVSGDYTAAQVTVSAAGTISSTNAQAALQELDGDIQSLSSTKANIASPTFTGTPAAPTPSTSDNSTQLATTAYVKAQSYAASQISNTPAGTVGATTVQNAINELDGDIQSLSSSKANLNSPSFTGTPTAPTVSTADSSTTLATTAFVQANAVRPGIAKGWVKVTPGNTVQASFGVSSTTDLGNGLTLVNWTSAFPDADYVAIPSIYDIGTNMRCAKVKDQTASSLRIEVRNASNVVDDPTNAFYLVAYGS